VGDRERSRPVDLDAIRHFERERADYSPPRVRTDRAGYPPREGVARSFSSASMKPAEPERMMAPERAGINPDSEKPLIICRRPVNRRHRDVVQPQVDRELSAMVRGVIDRIAQDAVA